MKKAGSVDAAFIQFTCTERFLLLVEIHMTVSVNYQTGTWKKKGHADLRIHCCAVADR